MSPPSDQDFGELIGEVRAIGKQITRMEESNSREHGTVIEAIGEVRRDLNSKASKTWVKEIADRTDKLESIRDEGSGAAKLIRMAQGAMVAGVVFAGFVLGKGGV